MSKGPEQTFFQRRHTDVQQVHEKMLKITNHQGNANQSHDEIPPHTQNSCHQKEKATNTGKDMEQTLMNC